MRRHLRDEPAPLTKLSPRERDVLALLAAGLTSKEMALQLGIALSTANYHLSNIYRKLGVHSRVTAALAYVQQKI